MKKLYTNEAYNVSARKSKRVFKDYPKRNCTFKIIENVFNITNNESLCSIDKTKS